MRYCILSLILLTLIIGSCKPDVRVVDASKMTLQPNVYAKNFQVWKGDGFHSVRIYPQFTGDKIGQEIFLIQTDTVPEFIRDKEDAIVVFTPVQNVLCYSTTHGAFIDALNKADLIRGVSDAASYYSPNIRNGLTSNRIVDMGSSHQPNYEQIVSLNPDLVLSFGNSAQSEIDAQCKSLGIPSLMISEFIEEHPLGRAEWIKFFGLLTGTEEVADDLFSRVETNYLKQKELVANKESPTVFTGIPWKGTWYMPGGESFVGTYLKDANANYLFGNNTERLSKSLSLESVYQTALNAEYWVDVGQVKSLKDIKIRNPLFADFNAFKLEQVYNYDGRLAEESGLGYDIYESGVVRPDLVLEDLCRIFHNDGKEEQAFTYYKKVPRE